MRIRIGMRFGFDALARLGRGEIHGEGAAPTESSLALAQRLVAVPGPVGAAPSPRRYSEHRASDLYLYIHLKLDKIIITENID